MATLTSSYQYLGRSSVMTSKSGSLSYYILLYGKTSANQSTGIHTVTIKEVLASTNKSTYHTYTQAHNGKINGSVAFSGTNKPSTAWELANFTAGGVTYKTGTLLGEGSINVDCTNGLAKDITLSCYYAFKSTGDSYTPANNTERTVSVTATLSAIPRQATILTAPNFSDTDNPTITYSNPTGNNVTSLEVAIYNNSGTQSYVPYKDDISKTGSSYKFNLTDSERNNLLRAAADSNSIPVRFYIRTKIGNTEYLSYLERTFSITNANPKITASVVDTNEKTIDLTDNPETLIKYYSNAKAIMSVEAQKGAAIDENLYIIRNGDNTGYGTEHTFKNIESNQFTFSAEDSRGNVGTAVLTPSMIDYIKLTCNIANNRPDALGNVDIVCNGDYFNGSFGAAENTLTVQYRYTITGTPFNDNWADMNVTITGNSYIAYADFKIPNFNQQAFYSFETRAIDKLDTISSGQASVKSIPVYHWGENDFVFEVPVTFKAGVTDAVSATDTGSAESDTYNGNKTITGNLRLKGDGTNYGNYLLFGDSTFCYIAELTDDIMTIHAKRINLDASSGVYVGDKAIPILDKGTWTPALNSSAISSYTTQYGWYSKMGQSVTVGFYIKATCKSGYNSTAISISGLPFTPMYAAAGGGMCSGAYVAANQNFQCFVAETAKTITTRTQACNNTSATNLTTSASGCWYPSGGGEVTLSGTISFIANS